MPTPTQRVITVFLVTLVFFGCGKKQDTAESLDYEIKIPQEIVATTDTEKPTQIGSLSQNAVEVIVTPGAFESAETIRLSTPMSIPSIEDGQRLVGSPIEIHAQKEAVRLAEKTQINFAFDKTLITDELDESFLRVGYYNGNAWEYVKPASVDMDDGTMTLETYHFSLLAPKISDEAKITEQFIGSQSLDNVIREGFNNESDLVTDQIIAMTLSKMGITDTEIQQKIFDKVAQAEAYKEIVDLYKSGDTEGASQKVAILAGEKIAQTVPESVFKEALGNVVGAADDIAKVSEAAGYAAEGQYKQAAKIIGENIADKFLITTAGKIAVEVIDGQIQSWKNAEVDAAYDAFKNGADGYFWGYNVDPGNFNAVWDQMRGVRRQLEIEAVKKENAIRVDAGMPELSEREEALVRNRVKTSYEKMFKERSQKEDIINKEKEKLKMIFDGFKEADLMSSVLGPKGLDKGYTYEQKLELLHHFAQKMMQDTNRTEVSDQDGLLMDTKISTSDLVMGAKKYFSEPDGKERYEEYLKERFKIGLYPTIDELQGTWSGTITITDVQVSDALKNEQSSGGSSEDEEGCDILALEDLVGKPNPITLDVKPTNKNGGMVTLGAEDDARSMPFTYNDGQFEAPINEDGATGEMYLKASKEGDSLSMNGNAYVTYGDDAKITATISVVK